MLAILQFDSASLPRLQRMLADGRLPALAALRDQGRWHTLDARATFLQSSTYMTLCTGVDVRDHGTYNAVPWSAADQRARVMYDFPHPPTVWERLSTAGRRSLIVDPILAWAPRDTRGIYLSGWQFEDRMVSRASSLPRSVRANLATTMGRPPKLNDVYGRHRVTSLMAWREHLRRAPARVADATVSLLGRSSFDLVWLNFGAVHKAGHHLWDPEGIVEPDASGEDLRRLRGGVEEVYEAVDQAITRVVEVLPRDADLIVFSPTGMAANTSRADLLPGMLDAVLAGEAREAHRRGASRSPIWGLRSSIPASWRDRFAGLLPDDLVGDLAARLYVRRDWRRTRAFAVPGENKGYIRLNLSGRERQGIVSPGEADELVATIARGLVTFRDPDGSPSITRVERMAEIAGGGHCVDRLPDLVVHWGERPAARLSHVTSPVHGEVVRNGVGSGRSGNHVDDAWAVIVPRRSRHADPGRAPGITDIAATACALAGADRSGLSGVPLLEMA